MGMTTTQSGFYENSESGPKKIKPIELIRARNAASKPLIQLLWFERAEKVVQQLQHVLKLIEFFNYASVVSNRIYKEYIPMLKKEKRNDLIRECKSLTELYSTYQLDYDYFSYKNSQTFSLFMVRLMVIVIILGKL